MITTNLFRVPFCDELGIDSFHVDDYEVDCNSLKYKGTMLISLLLTLLIPLGIPCYFLYIMKREVDNLEGGISTNIDGGAKLGPQDLDDEHDPYQFLVGDYRPEFYRYVSFTILILFQQI
jgi:hypothetical protein